MRSGRSSKGATCIGILGGGQLARMSAMAAYRLGVSVAILDEEPSSPAGQLTRHEFVGRVDDHRLLKTFAGSCDVATLENEFIDHHHLEYLERLGTIVRPASATIAIIQDKLLQKIALRKKHIPVAEFVGVQGVTDFDEIVSVIGLPFMMKSRKMGYDGYGNALINRRSQFVNAVQRLSRRHSHLMAERLIDFRMELAVMVARTRKETVVYPVVRTIQKNHICELVIAPANISRKIERLAKEIAVEAVNAVAGIGLFGIEMFLTKNDDILVNEMAPRPHNSGHYTIDACVTSQFENHIRSVMNLPLGSSAMVQPHAVMVNLLGKRNGSPSLRSYGRSLRDNDVHLHVYGKHSSRAGRKMGHITFVGTDAASLLKRAKRITTLNLI